MGKLKKCPACNNEISKKAKVCPHCGESNEPKSYGLGTLILVGGGLIWFISSIGGTSSTSNSTYVATPKVHTKTDQNKIPLAKKTPQETDKDLLEATIQDLKEFNKFNDYKSLSLAELKTRMQTMRFMGKIIHLREDRAKADKSLFSIWKEAKKLQLKVQVKHYPKMRDAIGPLMREQMWEHNIHVKTIGKGYTKIVLTGGFFASNMNIKNTQNSLSIMLHDYRFKKADYKWMKDASEWTEYTIESKKDNIL